MTCDIQNGFNLHNNVYLLSPHPDDVPLTFGGLMQHTSLFMDKKIHYCVFFNISTHTRQHQYKDNIKTDSEIKRVTSVRYTEDTNALDELLNHQNKQDKTSNTKMYKYSGADLLDAPLIGLPTHGDFTLLVSKEQQRQFLDAYTYVKDLLTNASLQGPSSVLAPLGLPNELGVHIDHFILREALLKAVYDLGEGLRCDIYFGEDQPYTGRNQAGAEIMIAQLSQRLGLQPISYPIDPEAKYNTVAKNYPSQLHIPDWRDAITNRAKALGNCERIYLLPRSNYSKFHVDPSCQANQSYCHY